MVSNKELNERREPGCWLVAADKKYFRVGNSCIKRTLRRCEWQTTPNGALAVPPSAYPQRWKTDAAILTYLNGRIDLPLPRLQAVFEDAGAFYHLTEYVDGVLMEELTEEQKQVVMKELLHHLATLKTLRSDTPGVPGEPLMCPPQRVTRGQWKANSCWKPKETSKKSSDVYVFCHNDLGQHNIIVDPATLKIKAIFDWEFGGFWPDWFERPFWERAGPMARHALNSEEDDVGKCREWLLENCDEVVMPHLG